MKEFSISQVAEILGVTPRMLRYYEKMGLITPARKEDSDYRAYTMETVKTLKYIVFFRKLRISVKDITIMLQHDGKNGQLETLQDYAHGLETEIQSLDRIRDVLAKIIQDGTDKDIWDHIDLDRDTDMLTPAQHKLKEKSLMQDMKTNPQTVRLVLLPAFTVASYRAVGEQPEQMAGEVVNEFIQKSGLYLKKPDARMFGFDSPYPGVMPDGLHGYEVWTTIPEDMEVPEPLIKKRFEGGLYAGMTIDFPQFQLWDDLTQWVRENGHYVENYAKKNLNGVSGCLEEHLNWIYSSHMHWPKDGIDGQVDLLLPIQRKEDKE